MFRNFLYKIYKSFFSKEVIEYINLKRKKVFYDKKRVIFIHIPKVAGTSVSYGLYGRTLGHFKAKMIKENYPKDFDEYFKFALVRNPYDRVYSAYKFIKQNGTEVMGIENKKVYHTKVFETYESFVMNWLPNVDIKKEDYVFQPQYSFIYDKDKLIVDKIWNIENMQVFTSEINELLGFQLNIEHLNKSKKTNKEISQEMREVIYTVYKKDFELLGYKK